MSSTKPGRDEEAISRFIERFASSLGETGFPRMAARVFVALLVSDDGKMTAAEIADRLQVSPAAVSSAVRFLTQVNLVGREREPGSRSDRISVRGDCWYEATLRKDQVMSRWREDVRGGVEAVGQDTPAGERLAETLLFLEFIEEEMPKLLERWRERKAELRRRGLQMSIDEGGGR
ncbi:MAG: MarR family transcriptional regulator [Actinobacteria bacterium]|nr:MAG: MarR family transcriptional regulator [Actinomycetota bacterium]